MIKLNNSPQGEAVSFWKRLGFSTIYEGDALIGQLPKGVVAFYARGQKEKIAQQKALQDVGTVSRLIAHIGPHEILYLYRLKNLRIDEVRDYFAGSSIVKGPGEFVTLPSGEYFTPDKWVNSADDLTVFDTLDGCQEPRDKGSFDDLPQQISEGTLLDRFSLRDADLGDEVSCDPLLGDVVLSGQATVVYAPPNSGKTLMMLHLVRRAVEDGRLQANRTYVVNADDSLQGMHEKRTLLAERGVHMLVPGKQGFESASLVVSMREMIDKDQCKDVLIIVDTLKKFVDLMDKRSAADFGTLVREFVLAGGTFFALAHTRKNESADGNLVYTGTTDIVEDFDAACLLTPLAGRGAEGEKLMQFQFIKRRGANVAQTYAFDDDPNLPYHERLATVRLVEDAEVREQVSYEQFKDDEPIIRAIRSALGSGVAQKMSVVRAAADKADVSRQKVLTVLDRYTGKNPPTDHWFYTVGERGAKIFQAHVEPEDIEE